MTQPPPHKPIPLFPNQTPNDAELFHEMDKEIWHLQLDLASERRKLRRIRRIAVVMICLGLSLLFASIIWAVVP